MFNADQRFQFLKQSSYYQYVLCSNQGLQYPAIRAFMFVILFVNNCVIIQNLVHGVVIKLGIRHSSKLLCSQRVFFQCFQGQSWIMWKSSEGEAMALHETRYLPIIPNLSAITLGQQQSARRFKHCQPARHSMPLWTEFQVTFNVILRMNT
jgi:hypothetical protein